MGNIKTKTEKPLKDTQHRDWLFTINNPEQTEKELFDYLSALNHIKYFTFQREKGEQGTEHYQGYLVFSVCKLFSTTKNIFSEPNIKPAAHLEPRKGTKTQARDYCQKEDTRIGEVYEYGTFTAEGERADLNQLRDMIEQGADDLELAKNNVGAYARHLPFVDRHREKIIQQKFGKVRRLDLNVVYIYGRTGLGKTRHVMDKYGDENVYRITDYDGHLFDNYNNEDVIIFEEFRSQVRIDIMLNYLDVYPLRLPARYNNKIACFTKIYIITNLPLQEQYRNVQKEHRETWQAFLRRIKTVYNFDLSKDIPVNKLSGRLQKPLNMLKPIEDDDGDLPF